MMNDKERLENIRHFASSMMMFVCGVVVAIFAIGEKVDLPCTEWWESCKQMTPELNTAIVCLAFALLALIAILAIADPPRPKPKKKKCVLCKRVKK